MCSYTTAKQFAIAGALIVLRTILPHQGDPSPSLYDSVILLILFYDMIEFYDSIPLLSPCSPGLSLGPWLCWGGVTHASPRLKRNGTLRLTNFPPEFFFQAARLAGTESESPGDPMWLARALEQKRAHPVLLPARPPPPAATHCLGCPIAWGDTSPWGAPWPCLVCFLCKSSSRWFSDGCCPHSLFGGCRGVGGTSGLPAAQEMEMHWYAFRCLRSQHPLPVGVQGCGSTGDPGTMQTPAVQRGLTVPAQLQ